MQLAELSARSGVTIPSIKYYRRECLLPPGVREGQGRAEYDGTHLERLRLVRALIGAGGLSLARVRAVLETIDSQPSSTVEVLAAAFADFGASPDLDIMRAQRLVGRLGWSVPPESGRLGDLASAMEAMDAAGYNMTDDYLVALGRAVEPLAQLEIDSVPVGSPSEVLRYVVLGTVLVRPVILALRELAHLDASARRYVS